MSVDLVLVLLVCTAIWFGAVVTLYRHTGVRWWFWSSFLTLTWLAMMLLICQLAWYGMYLAPR